MRHAANKGSHVRAVDPDWRERPTLCGLSILMTCVTQPSQLAGTTDDDGDISCSWNDCKNRVQGTGRRAQVAGCRAQSTEHTGYKVQGERQSAEHRVQSTGHRVYRIQGTGYRAHRAQGTGYSAGLHSDKLL